ncbi:MAG: tetratricopeptide repeat protein [bacterium]
MRTKREIHILSLFIAAWCAVSIGVMNVREAQAKSFNLVLITIDTLRADHLGCYGYQDLKTPAIDLLAEEGVMFTRHYTPVPITLPSHATIMTGLYPPSHGVRNNGTCILGDEALTLAEILKNKKYNTAGFVGAYVLHSRFGLAQGFDVFNDRFPPSPELALPLYNERLAGEVMDEAIKWLKEHRNEKFFLWIHLFDPHAPYSPPEPFREPYKLQPYDGEIAYVDSQIDRLRKELTSLNLNNKTLFVLTADHGEGLDEHGEKTHAVFIYDSTLHVPLIFHLPALLPSGVKISEMVCSIDILPTILDIMEIPLPSQIQGCSLSRLIRGTQKGIERNFYCESHYPELNFGWSRLEGIKTKKWKFIEAPRSELYRIDKDPQELNNIIVEEEDVAKALRDELHDLGKKLSSSAEGDLARTVSLDRETRERLGSLGYVWSESHDPKDKMQIPDSQLPDPKDMIKTLEDLDVALFYSMLGLYQKAIEYLEKVVKANPGNFKAHFYLAANYEQAGEYDKAIAEYQAVVSMDPAYPDGHNSLGALYEKQGALDKALEQLELAEELGGNYMEMYHNLGVVYDRKKEYEKALKCLLKAAELTPDHPSVRNNLGGVYLKLGRINEAIREFQTVIKLEADHAEAYNNLGIAYKMSGEYEKAEQSFKKAIEIDAEYAGSFSNLAGFYIMRKNYDQAITAAREALHVDEKCVDAYINLGITYFYLGRYQEAIPYLETATSLDRENAEAFSNLGLCYFFLNEYEKAKQYYQKSLILCPENVNGRVNLGTIFFRENKMHKAIEEWKKSLKIDTESVEAYMNLGSAYFKLEDHNQAIKNWKAALKLDPNHVNVHLNLGNCYYQMGLINLAIAEWLKTTSIDDSSIAAHKNLASAYYTQGRKDLALKEWQKVSSLDPYSVDAAYYQGMIHLNQGNYDQSIARLSWALSLDPSHSEAQALLNQLKWLNKSGEK